MTNLDLIRILIMSNIVFALMNRYIRKVKDKKFYITGFLGSLIGMTLYWMKLRYL